MDERNNKVYKTIRISNQVWTAQNLDYPVEGRYSYCYDMDSTNCETHGYLYRWDTAINIDQCEYGVICDPPERTQGVRPEGWHLPNQTEWNDLVNKLGGNKVAGHILKAQSGWGSSNTTHFQCVA
ncbi:MULTISPECIES: FISUMP domain-containing protein [unclassified Fibrobacter]|uniref:FISUMP domain-containing protein n=1 Tax=unclassified Fibrobacter TaxID=2634177 RepID=UPI000917BF0E|nr:MULTISPECIES: FISUMP domain-containing protein [unclassified Fibrobacter]SHK91524.1 major paralogous domain-containing protein [Fibrobacter sp. UWH6]